MASRPRSLVWNPFTISIADDSKAICNHCNNLVLQGGKNPKTYGISNLLKHLCLNHESEYSTLQAEEAAQVKEKGKTSGSRISQTMLDNYVQTVTPLSFNHHGKSHEPSLK